MVDSKVGRWFAQVRHILSFSKLVRQIKKAYETWAMYTTGSVKQA